MRTRTQAETQISKRKPQNNRRGGVLSVLHFALCVLPSALLSAPADTAEAKPAYRIVDSGPVAVTAKLKPRRTTKPLTVGDRFKLELTVRRHRNLKASQPFADSLGAFLVLDDKPVTKYRGDTVIDVHELEIAAFAAGELTLPRFLVSYPDSGEVLAARSESLGVKVQSVLPEKMEDINDLKPQIQFPNLLPLWIALGIVAAAGLAYLGLRLFRLLSLRRLAEAPLPEPWEEALAALEKISARDWLGAGEVKRFYYAVSEILKRYLTRRFGFPAIDQTTTEIVFDMKRARVELRDEFAGFFRHADLVKYAKLVPEAAEMEGIVPTARDLVQRTTPQPEAREKSGPAAR